MLFLLSLVIRTLSRVLTGGRSDDNAKDLEILVLRHQVRILRRKAGRPRLRPLDRVLLASASRALPRDRWGSFIVTPTTLLRRHRELVRRKWSFRRGRRPGRPPLDPEVQALVPSDGPGELEMGLHQDLRGVAQARDQGRSDDDQDPASPNRPRSSPEAEWADLV